MAMKPKMPPARFAKKSAPTNERKNVQKITEEGRPKKVAPSRGERGKSDVSGKGSDAKREAPPKAEKKRSQKITEEGKPGKVRAVKAGAAGKAITNKPDIAEHGQSDVPDMLHGKSSAKAMTPKFKTGGATPDADMFGDSKSPSEKAQRQAEHDAEKMQNYAEVTSDPIRHANAKAHLASKAAKIQSLLG